MKLCLRHRGESLLIVQDRYDRTSSLKAAAHAGRGAGLRKRITKHSLVIYPLSLPVYIIDKVIEEAKWPRDEVDTVLLVGGTSRIPLFCKIAKMNSFRRTF